VVSTRAQIEPHGANREDHPVTTDEAHRLAREEGVSKILYAIVRGIVVPFVRLYFGLRITAAERIPPRAP